MQLHKNSHIVVLKKVKHLALHFTLQEPWNICEFLKCLYLQKQPQITCKPRHLRSISAWMASNAHYLASHRSHVQLINTAELTFVKAI